MFPMSLLGSCDVFLQFASYAPPIAMLTGHQENYRAQREHVVIYGMESEVKSIFGTTPRTTRTHLKEKSRVFVSLGSQAF